MSGEEGDERQQVGGRRRECLADILEREERVDLGCRVEEEVELGPKGDVLSRDGLCCRRRRAGRREDSEMTGEGNGIVSSSFTLVYGSSCRRSQDEQVSLTSPEKSLLTPPGFVRNASLASSDEL